MLDSVLRPWIDPPLNMAGRVIAKVGIGPDLLTLFAFAAGMAGAVAIGIGQFGWALALILIGRVLDGLDGAVARASQPSDRGGFLDIALDFVFYGSVPLAFAALDPFRNSLPAALLIASFYANGSAFLAYAIMAQKRGQAATEQGPKSLFYMAGLTEGTETIAAFVIFCLVPSLFPLAAAIFAVACYISAASRIILGWRSLN
jgi:phosphatidylglycerophosphate synthase